MGFFASLNINEFFERAKFKELDQRATEAVVDALVFAMLSDNAVDQVELDEVLRFAGRLKWQSDMSLGAYVNDLREKAQGSDAANLIPSVCQDIATRIAGFDWLAEEVYYLAAKIVGADGDYRDEERGFLVELTRAVQLDPETQRLVIQRIRAEDL